MNQSSESVPMSGMYYCKSMDRSPLSGEFLSQFLLTCYLEIHFPGLERCLYDLEHVLLLQRTPVLFPAPMRCGGPQSSVSSVSGDPMASLALEGTRKAYLLHNVHIGETTKFKVKIKEKLLEKYIFKHHFKTIPSKK